MPAGAPERRWLVAAWILAAGSAGGMRAWNALAGPALHGYDAWGHVSYVLFMDVYGALPTAQQGWSYFHPPLHYALGWLLAQSGSAAVLVRGLGLAGSAASLAIALLCARVVARTLPGRPWLALASFSVLAFMPVHVYASPMVGGELTSAFWVATAATALIVNERRSRPLLALDAMTGTLAGLALLTKLTAGALLPVLGAVPLLRALRLAGSERSLARLLARGAALAIPVLLIAGPFYARNVTRFSTPLGVFRGAADTEAAQPPGSRALCDYGPPPLALFSDSAFDAPHMLRSVWGSVYLNAWFDTHGASQLPVDSWPGGPRALHFATLGFGALGLVPTALALAGAALSARRAVRDPGASTDTIVCLLAAASLVAFVAFTVSVPTWAAVKAAYLFNLSLPFGFFVARALEASGARARLAAPALVALALACTLVFTSGAALERRYDRPEMAVAHLFFGDPLPMRAELAKRPGMLGPGAAAELVDGRFYTARAMYARDPGTRDATPTSRVDPLALNRLAVATALDRDLEEALRLLDAALAQARVAEPLANRGALLALAGRLEEAEGDLRSALALEPGLPPAWSNLGAVLAWRGRDADAEAARERARETAARPPTGFPYAVGTGTPHEAGAEQRWLLQITDGGLVLYLPPGSRLPEASAQLPRR